MQLPPSTHDPESVREAADRILAEGRYDRPPESIPDRILGWLGEQIGKVLGSAVGSGAGTLVFWAVVLAAIGLVVYLIIRYGRLGKVPSLPGRDRHVMVEMTRLPAEWLAEAERLEAEGRWREAMRCRYRAVIGELVRQGAIRERAGRTAREHLRDVTRARPQAAGPLSAATELFESVWYGDAACGADESALFQALAAEVRAASSGDRPVSAAAGAP